MSDDVKNLIDFIIRNNGINDKAKMIKLVKEEFNLTKERSVYFNDSFAIRFSYSNSNGFSNTVISLSNLRKYDEIPFIVCLVTPVENILYLANTTFISKVSHSSQELRVDNIRGSINGSDIVKSFEGIENAPDNFERLFNIHSSIEFKDNLIRLVEATNNISPSGRKFVIINSTKETILEAPTRATNFVNSPEFTTLKEDLDSRVNEYYDEILIASFIENVKLRGMLIEYLIVGEDEKLRNELLSCLRKKSNNLPQLNSHNSLGDFNRIFDDYNTATDVKTKILILSSNPKAYNIDKLLEFLSKPKSVFMFYFIGIEPNKIVNSVLTSMFQRDLLNGTVTLKHWAGRNSRGVTQFEGHIIDGLIRKPNNDIDLIKSEEFIKMLIDI